MIYNKLLPIVIKCYKKWFITLINSSKVAVKLVCYKCYKRILHIIYIRTTDFSPRTHKTIYNFITRHFQQEKNVLKIWFYNKFITYNQKERKYV